jgi:hypothetical protein
MKFIGLFAWENMQAPPETPDESRWAFCSLHVFLRKAGMVEFISS